LGFLGYPKIKTLFMLGFKYALPNALTLDLPSLTDPSPETEGCFEAAGIKRSKIKFPLALAT
jgi:hypothetical protein